MMMRKTAVALTAAAALGLAVTAAPKPADAAWWVAPAIVAGVVGGVALGAAASNNAYAYYNGPGDVYVSPTPACRWVEVERRGRIVQRRICQY
jgi:hypothetical protein